jgi:SAM-dependent methyltransferase
MRTIERKVADYYGGKVRIFGPTPRGVDWNGEDSQRLRFRQFDTLWAGDAGFSICDLGCGYGALLEYLDREGTPFARYLGVDLSADMLEAAGALWAADRRASFKLQETPVDADYVVASGILNVRLDTSETAWADYADRLIEGLCRAARKGFAFNALTAHSDASHKRPDLWYADPGALANRLIDPHRRRVRLLHDYPLFEFTILVWHI